MGIHLDWEVKSDGGWEHIGEDPAVIANRQKRARFLHISVMVLGILMLITALIVGALALRGNRQSSRALKATVATEIEALSSGDLKTFTPLQVQRGEWPLLQQEKFEQYQALATRLELTGEIVDLQQAGSEATVTLLEMFDGAAYHTVWFYEHTETGWQHAPPRIAYWGEARQLDSTWFQFEYYERDQVFVEALVDQMDTWWEAPCWLVACTELPAPTRVIVTPDPFAFVGWAAYDEQVLIIPSPLLSRMRADSTLDGQLAAHITALIAQRWAQELTTNAAPDHTPTSDMAWLEAELSRWLGHAINPILPPAPVLGPLSTQYGDRFMPGLVAALTGNANLVLLLQTLTGQPADQLDVDWGSYLEHRLQGEAGLIADGYQTEATLLFTDPERVEAVTLDEIASQLTRTNPVDINVLDTRAYSGLLWTDVSYVALENTEAQALVTRVPFRLVDNRWVRTGDTLPDWGDLKRTQSGGLTLWYYALNEDFVIDLFPALLETYNQLSVDLAAPTQLALYLAPCSPDSCAFTLEADSIVILAPEASTRPADQAWILNRQHAAAAAMLDDMLATQVSPLALDVPLVNALRQWELGQLDIEALALEASQAAPATLDELWLTNRETLGTASDQLAAMILVDLLLETYGAEYYPALMRHLPDSADMDDWLLRSLNITRTDIEAAWQARLQAVQSP